MEVIHRRCCGLDVHKETVVACRRILGPRGKLTKELRTFGTTTEQLRALAQWLSEGEVKHVAMESTGVYWKPIWNVLGEQFELLLVNAQHIKKVPGRKTDVKDAEWIAELLQHGLLRGSFVPPEQIRQLRDLTRQRTRLVDQHNAVVNRIHKTLEDANIKLSGVVSDLMGVSGRAMLQALVDGQQNPEQLSELARHTLRKKLPQLKVALEGRVTEHHRFMLKHLLAQVAFLESEMEQFDKHIEELTRPFEAQIQRLCSTPGLKRRSAESILAEIGPAMEQFPSEGHLASWAGISPGNNESAGKSKSGKAPKGNKWLRRTLVEAAWAATRSKGTYLAAQYRRLAPRRGKKRALVAVAHSILQAAYHILKDAVDYRELGAEHFDRLNPEQLIRHYVKRLEKLGQKVTLQPQAA